MTEKQYGGASKHGLKKSVHAKKESESYLAISKKEKNIIFQKETEINFEELKKAGEINKIVKKYAREIIKKDVLLLDVAEKIENKIYELGGKPAFPINLSINEVAAHSTPSHDDRTKAEGLLKIDIGVQVNGFIADSAFSLDLENSEENKKLILSVEKSLEEAIKSFEIGVEINKIGEAIEKSIKSFGLQPVVNLSGHSLKQYELHSGIIVPNYNNNSKIKIVEGVYAIEPFSTNGAGKVIDGKLSGIYILEKEGNVRDMFAREVLSYIKEEYKTLPFCSRWLVKKFGTRALIALKRIEEAGLLHHYPQLIEISRKNVAQAEHTLIIREKEKIVTT